MRPEVPETPLTLTEVADIFRVHPRILKRCVLTAAYPPPLPHEPGAKLFWLPSTIAKWQWKQVRLAADASRKRAEQAKRAA
jgi:hypothetical protein